MLNECVFLLGKVAQRPVLSPLLPYTGVWGQPAFTNYLAGLPELGSELPSPPPQPQGWPSL